MLPWATLWKDSTYAINKNEIRLCFKALNQEPEDLCCGNVLRKHVELLV